MGSHVPSLPLPSLKAKMTDEWRLVRAVQVDAPGAFREFVESYQNPIYSLVIALLGDPALADTVAQDVFVEAHRTIRQFKTNESPLVRLYQITLRLATAKAEARTLRSAEPGRDRALELLRNLNDQERVLLTLREVQGFSISALSELFRVDEVAIHANLLTARRHSVRLMSPEMR